MAEMKFQTPVFIKETSEEPIDLVATPDFHNDGGRPRYVAKLPRGATLIQAAHTDPRPAVR